MIAVRLRLALSARVSASAGVASNETDGTDPELLHQRADERLYRAKRARGEAGRPPALALHEPAQ